MKKSEEKLNEIFNFIKDYTYEKGFPPSYREIAFVSKLKSTNSVKIYIDKLKELNLIRTTDSKNRCIEIVNNAQSMHNNTIPLVGRVAAGLPIMAEQNIEEEYNLSENLFGSNDIFMLRIKGDSMINIGIYDNDIAVVKQQNNAENGDLVVAMIDNEATVKNIYFEKDTIRLQPHNDKYSPIYSKNVTIVGKVVGLIRQY